MFKSIKGLAIALLLAATATTAQTQKGKQAKPEEPDTPSSQTQAKGSMAAGGNLTFATGDSYTNFGIGAKFQYNVTDPTRLEGSFTYLFETDYVSMWDFSVNAHWLFPVADKIAVYPLAGLAYQTITVNWPTVWGVNLGSYSVSRFGFNLGGGADYGLTDKLILNAELKYRIISAWSRLLISAGVAYKF